MREATSAYIENPKSAFRVQHDQHAQQSLISEDLPPWLHSGVQTICKRFPTWLSNRSRLSLNPTAQALAPVLDTLRRAAEAYLEVSSSLQKVGVSSPLTMTAHYRNALHSAASSISLSLIEPCSAGLPASIYAAKELEVSGKCDEWERHCDPEQVILTIDYSQAALTSILFEEDTGIYHPIHTVHDEKLGVLALDQACESPDGPEDCTAGLRQALVDVTRASPSGDHVDKIVIHGESATNSRLNRLLQEVLRDATPLIVNDGLHAKSVDPLSAAARGLAKTGLLAIDQPAPDGCNCNDFTPR